MSDLNTHHAEPAANPLDIMEQVVAANDWAFDRRSDHEIGRAHV